MISGIASAIPTTRDFRVSTIISAFSLPTEPNAVRPAIRTVMPRETAMQERPKDIIDAESDKIDGSIGLRSFAATYIVVNAPARTTRPVAALAGSIPEIAISAPVSPVSIDTKPKPRTNDPAPRTANEPPRAIKDVANLNIDGIKGLRILVATPTTVKVPARATRLTATPTIPADEISIIAEARTMRAPANSVNVIAEADRP